jgi:uncharacterized membrane protein YqjE
MADAVQPSAGRDSVRGVVQAALRYTEARGRLLQLEAQEAGTQVRQVGVSAVFAIGGLLGAWLLLMPVAVVGLAEVLKVSWLWVASGLGLLHLLIGGVAAVRVMKRLSQARYFEESLRQFQNDRAWLAATPPD